MANLPRSSSFLPTIKCSMCAQDIEISQMGDHVCGGPSSGEPTPPPESMSVFDRLALKQNPTNSLGYAKPGRAPPPRVDTFAANRPFLPQDQFTPVSASPAQSVSPMTPNDDGRSFYSTGPLRSATAPLYTSPPSPEHLSSNLDSAFPMFPTPKRSQTQQPQIRDQDRLGGHNYAEADPRFAPVSPRTATSGGLLQRMNTIAPGPFDINRRKRTEAPAAEHVYQRTESKESIESAEKANVIGMGMRRPSAAGFGHSRTSTSSSNGSNGSRSGFGAPRIPRKNGYGGFGPPPGEQDSRPITPESRSQTFPIQIESQDFRRPSEPSSLPTRSPLREPSLQVPLDNDRLGGGSHQRQKNPSMSGPDLTRPLPPRGGSLLRPRPGVNAAVPNLNLAAEFGASNPYHTPTESSSSNNSAYSEGSKASSRSSPPLSTAGTERSRQQPSDARVHSMMAEIEDSMSELRPIETKAAPPPQQPRQKEQFARSLQPPQRLNPSFLSPESPMDPAIQDGRLSPNIASNRPSNRPPNRPPNTDRRNNQRSRSPMRSEFPIEPLSPVMPPEPVQQKKRRPTGPKGNCKGCGEVIKGKSISSADGRLTGRYHKECFVCKTCSEPFQTATFYVINDAPYCERHYHKLNGSVCQTCDRGIEGQYLESERRQKYHPGCLTCADCKRSLRHDYFEMKGQVYCERDAFRRAQQGRFLGAGGGSSNRMERRTTRLMMM